MNISNTYARNRALFLVVAVSLGLHLVALVLFGAFKVVESIVREEQTFEAPAIVEVPQEQPEYVVNLEQRNRSSAPPRPNPIVVDSPDVSIPALNIDVNIANSSSYGRGAGGAGLGSGGIMEMREMVLNLTEFGYSDFVEGTLEGTLFDTKRDRNGKAIVDMSKIDFSQVNSWLTPRMQEITREFTDGSWNISQLERKFFSATNKLYASYFLIPRSSAQKAPEAFNAADEIQAVSILAYYEGEFTPSETGQFRFVGKADDCIVIRANNRIVFDGSLSNSYSEFDQNEQETWPGNLLGIGGINTGEWMSWKEGRPVDLEVLLAEAPGGIFYAMLFYQKKGENKLRLFTAKALTEEEKSSLKSISSELSTMF